MEQANHLRCRNRNKKQGFGGASLHRTRSHGRDIPARMEPITRSTYARCQGERAASIPRQYLCLVPVLGSPGRKCIAIPKQVARELLERGTRSAVAAPSTLGGWVAGHIEVETATTIMVPGPETR